MRPEISRPVLLAIALLLIASVIAYLELAPGLAGPEAAQTETAPPQSEKHDEPAEKPAAATDATTKKPDAARTGAKDRAEPVEKQSEASRTKEETPEQSAVERIAGKEAEFERAKEIVAPTGFVNTGGVSLDGLRGEKVVLLEFWTYTCYNCQNVQPRINAWHDEYADDGLRVVGVHSPEFGFEKKYANVEAAVREAGIEYPVVLDNRYATWNAYGQRYWPAVYLIDSDGFIRYRHFGEGAYEETEAKIQELLAEKNRVTG